MSSGKYKVKGEESQGLRKKNLQLDSVLKHLQMSLNIADAQLPQFGGRMNNYFLSPNSQNHIQMLKEETANIPLTKPCIFSSIHVM